MGQVEILRFLQNHPDRWFTTKEICDGIGIGYSLVVTCLRSMRRSEQVEFKKEKEGWRAPYYYRSKGHRGG